MFHVVSEKVHKNCFVLSQKKYLSTNVHAVLKYVISLIIDMPSYISTAYVEGMEEHILGALYLSHFHFEMHFCVSEVKSVFL